ALRDQKLVKVVEHAYAQSPYYKKMMDERGVRPTDVRGLADLHKLPILTKDALREHADELRCRDYMGPVEIGATGGTTGQPIRIVRDKPGSAWQRACYWRGFGWAGLRLGDSFVQLFGGTLGVASKRPLDRAKSWFSGKHFLPAFELSPDNVTRYLEVIRA